MAFSSLTKPAISFSVHTLVSTAPEAVSNPRPRCPCSLPSTSKLRHSSNTEGSSGSWTSVTMIPSPITWGSPGGAYTVCVTLPSLGASSRARFLFLASPPSREALQSQVYFARRQYILSFGLPMSCSNTCRRLFCMRMGMDWQTLPCVKKLDKELRIYPERFYVLLP